MATWQNTGIKMLRVMLNDAGAAVYTDDRLEDLLIVSAYYIVIDINFSTTYTIDVEANSIGPEPTDQIDGAEFINFMVLKAACLSDESGFRNAAMLQGVRARCGPAVLETKTYGQYLKELLTAGPCKSYEDLKTLYNFSYEGKKILRSVMSPFVSNEFYPPMGGGGTGQQDTENPVRSRGY